MTTVAENNKWLWLTAVNYNWQLWLMTLIDDYGLWVYLMTVIADSDYDHWL